MYKAELVEDERLRDKIINTCKEWLTKDERTKEIHVSDVMDPRLAVLRRIYGERMTDRNTLLFITGRSYHEILEALVEKEVAKHEVVVTWNDIVGTIDVTYEGDAFELKSTRSYMVHDITEIPNRYIRQLGHYVAIRNPDKEEAVGKLGILYLTPRGKKKDNKLKGSNDPVLKIYSVKYNNLTQIRDEMLLNKNMILDVINGKKPFKELRKCPRIESEEGFMCDNCLYKEECIQMESDNW